MHTITMNHSTDNYSLFINSLLSSKEILITKNSDIEITECSVFKNTKTTIPVDLIETKAEQSSRPDYQWLLFAVINFFAAIVFSALTFSQHLGFLLSIAATFTLLGALSVHAAFKFKNKVYRYHLKDTKADVLTLTSNDINDSQIREFVDILDQQMIQNRESDIEEKQHDPSFLVNQIDSYSGHLEFLYDEGIIDDVMLDRLRQKVYNKVYGIVDTRPLAKVIPLPVTGT